MSAGYLIVEAMNRLGVAYMIVGSFSSNAYGVERSTKDPDFVIETDADIGRIRDAIVPGWRMNPQVGFETKLRIGSTLPMRNLRRQSRLAYIYTWVDRHGTRTLLEKIRSGTEQPQFYFNAPVWL